MKFFNLLLIVLAATFVSCSTFETVEEQEELFESANLVEMTDDEEELFNIINEHRTAIGLNELKFDNSAYQTAQEHNVYMIRNQRISHDNFSARINDLVNNANATAVGENVARDFSSNTGVLDAWLKSPSHKENIEGDYTHTGISITYNNEGTPYFTQMFISK